VTWLFLSIGSALFYALQGVWTKRISQRTPLLSATWAIFLFSFPLLAAAVVIEGFPAVGPRFIPAVLATTVLSVISFSLYVSALHRSDLGLTYPLLALTPVLLVPVEWLLLGDLPARVGLTGIALAGVGVYLLNFNHRAGGPLEPLRAVARDSGARRMLAVALLWGVGAALDRVAVLESSPRFYGAALTGLTSLAFLPIVMSRDGGVRAALRPGIRGALLVQGALFAAMFLFQMSAIELTLASYVVSVKRSGAIITVILGAVLFRETGTGFRLAGTIVILAGVSLIALSPG
jgi:drug/metabolite transporter (DMT)-like permease